MKPCHRLTIIGNRYRAHDLRVFRTRVETYFEQALDDGEDLPPYPDAVRAARMEINRRLPRVLQIVEAAELGVSPAASRLRPLNRPVEILQVIFSAQYTDGRHQEILDVLDLAIGVHDAGALAALLRTVNPFHYVVSALAFLAGLPRRALAAIGLIRPPEARGRPDQLTGLEATLQLIEARFADMRDWQARVFADHANQVTDLAERMDFLERVLAQQRPAGQLGPSEKKVVTPH